MEELPYRAEYAKTGRASCKGCKSPIAQGSLRLAVYVQSPVFDGRMTKWYHSMCFFSKQRPKAVGDIENFQSLRIEDQDSIKEKIDSGSSIAAPTEKKGKKRGGKDAGALKDFSIEYSKSSRATCRGCEQKIMKEEIRISKKDFETEVGKRYGGQDMWHHLDCFEKLRSELLFFDNGENLPGFNTLKKEDKQLVKDKLPPVKDAVPVKIQKMKDEPKDPEEVVQEATEEKKYKSQNKEMYACRDRLKQLKSKHIAALLEANNLNLPKGIDATLDLASDVMTFGVPLPCEKCGGQFEFQSKGYVCTGNSSEWSKCLNMTTDPKRKKFIVPKSMKEEFEFLKSHKSKVKKRIIKALAQTVSVAVKKEDEANEGPKIERKAPPLYNMEFVIHKTVDDKEKVKKRIQKLGGKVVTKIHEKTAGVISTPEEVEKMGSRITLAKDMDVQVLPETFLNDAEKDTDIKPHDLIRTASISEWGSDPLIRIPPETLKSSSKSKSMFAKSGSTKVNLKIKDGGIVDPDSGLGDKAHIYQKHGVKYNVVLGLTDLQTKKNSYYKLQLLESDDKHRYWLFRAWGRIGTTIGGNKVEDFDQIHLAMNSFMNLYEEKTGNSWGRRDDFVKIPGKMYPVDIDYSDDVDSKVPLENSKFKSNLSQPIQDLVAMVFDVNRMKKTMLEFELDLEKMPLGKLSKAQLHKAFAVLSELKELVGKPDSETAVIGACNRFYTLVPHDFGIDNPPLITTEDAIKVKLDMLDNLMELEIAYNLLQNSDATDQNPIDAHYKQLKTDLEILDRESVEFKLIEDYTKNTHAKTHSSYELEILEIFKVSRHGENKRFKPFKKLHNRKLLWHGSRVTNFAGILSQGLRIAPPEAPVTGYMFGKGIYFADMVSKSANYCCTDKANPVGLMLLCEVALGNMCEREHADYIEKLPSGKHSVKGVGRTQPDPEKSHKLPDGVEIPLGESVTSATKASLLYNEYIVYDVAQVNVKYLLKMNFKYKY